MHYDRSCFLSRCVTSIQKNRVTYSISDSRSVSPDCKMCVRVTNTGNNAIIQVRLTWWGVLQFGASCFYICATQ